VRHRNGFLGVDIPKDHNAEDEMYQDNEPQIFRAGETEVVMANGKIYELKIRFLSMIM